LKTPLRLTLTLAPSRIQLWLGRLCALLTGLTFAIVLDVLFAANGAITAGAGLMSALTFVLFTDHTLAKSLPITLIFADAGVSCGQLWIGSEPPAIDGVLPELRAMRRYLGLIWLQNSTGAQVLIWPDSMNNDSHRRVRVWLGIYARM
jgi:hypothetical protein